MPPEPLGEPPFAQPDPVKGNSFPRMEFLGDTSETTLERRCPDVTTSRIEGLITIRCSTSGEKRFASSGFQAELAGDG